MVESWLTERRFIDSAHLIFLLLAINLLGCNHLGVGACEDEIKYMRLARLRHIPKYESILRSIATAIVASKSHHCIDSKMQTAKARRSGSSRMPRRLLLSFFSSGDFMAPADVSVVPERSKDTVSMPVAVLCSDVRHPWHWCGRYSGSKEPGNRALSSAGRSGSGFFFAWLRTPTLESKLPLLTRM